MTVQGRRIEVTRDGANWRLELKPTEAFPFYEVLVFAAKTPVQARCLELLSDAILVSWVSNKREDVDFSRMEVTGRLGGPLPWCWALIQRTGDWHITESGGELRVAQT
jgi:hypothetical protein